ncbi:MAG: hypothetical protein K8S00_14685 [Bacteroidales bacterium]|nr:hypothetical protein [Bacteroidales bacterium]
MKNKKYILVFSAITLILSSLLFVKCNKIQDPTEGLKLIINYNVIKTTLSITFMDAATGDPIGYNDNKVVNVNVNGKDADKILDVTGATRTTFNSANGFLGFGVDPSFTPSQTNPIEFTVVAKCSGYANTSIPITLWSESDQSVIITMVDLNNLPDGVTTVTDYSVYVSDSVVDADVVIETPAAGSTGTKAQLTILQGTKIKDAGGNILSGNFTAKMVYYNNMDDGALAAFPGGLTASAEFNGNTENVMFYSGGFASVEIIDASGTKAKTFENHDLELMIEMSNNTYNRNTDAQIEDQDTVPLWSYDLETGKWNIEEWTLIEESGGMFQTTAGLSHLSFFNLDWWYPLGPAFPSAGAMLRFSIIYGIKTTLEDPETIALEITIRKKVDNTFIKKYLIQAPIGEDYPIGGWGLGNIPVILEIRNLCDATNIQVEEINDPSQGVYDITLQNVQSTGHTVTVYFEGWCPNNPDIIVRPSMPFVYREICSGEQWIWTYMHEGYATLYNLNLNSAYSVGVYYDGEFFEEGVILDDPNQSYSIEFTPEVCDIIGQ